MPGVCPRCLREVYFAEEKLALGKVWHNFCFSCRNCRKLLDSWTVATHSGELFCRNCYNRLFSITSVRAALPLPVNHIFPPADTRDLPALSPCDSLSDCCCCCYCNEEPSLIDPQNQDSEIRGSSLSASEKQRMRGGGGGEDEEILEENPILEVEGSKRCLESESFKLGAQSSVNTICQPSSSPTTASAWYNRQQSASQSVVSHSSSAQQPLVRPSSTPASAQATGFLNANTCLAHRRPGSPCRANYERHQYSKQCHRYHCYDSQSSDRVPGSQEHSKIIRDCQGKSFIQNYRNRLRPMSPGARTAGGGGCAQLPPCQQQDDGCLGGSCCLPKLPTGCECLGGGQDCQRCGRKVYQAEMQIASGVPYHNICFSCFCCRKPLETLTYHENCGEIYCKQCYVRNFGPQGYGYAGVLQTPM